MKQKEPKKPRRTLKELNLLDRFLFAEAMEDPEIMQIVLEIILGREIVLKYLPQAEKEGRTFPLRRHIKMDVWAQDMEGTIYDTEVQRKNTRNLPKRSRYYQGVLDGKLLESGEIDFNQLNDLFVIIICPFDIFGQGRYRYTFRMRCHEDPEMSMEDGAVRIFLNTRGFKPGEVSKELVEFLRYVEHTDETTAKGWGSEKMKELQRRVEGIKSNEEVSVRYMQEWEEREMDRRAAREEARVEGISVLIKTCKELGVSNEDTLSRVERMFELSKEDARAYLDKYWEF